ncbi:MAG: TolC family protein [Rhodocyclaceae bacterium]|nr:TolC family protein [Rhodocyclaceae bacterium]
MLRRATSAWLTGLLLGFSGGLWAAEPTPGADLASLLAYAREHNPELQARAADVGAERARIDAATALPDPRVQVELMDVTNEVAGGGASLLPGDVGVTRYRLIQPLPYFGKLALRGELAARRAERGEARLDVARVDIEAAIAAAYVRYYRAVSQGRIQRETLALLEALERLVLTRYGVGLVPQQDAVRVQAEITAVKIDLLETERLVEDARVSVNAALPRSPDAPLAVPEALPAMAPVGAFDALAARARERAPLLASLRSDIAMAEAEQAIVTRERYPDFALGLTNNRPKQGDATWDVMLEVTIPLQQSRRRSDEASAGQRVLAARARVEAEAARIDGQLGRAVAAFRSARDKAEMLSRTLLPQSQANLEAAEAGYESGRINFNTLIEAERQILRTRLALLAARTDARLQQVEIQRLTGAEW